MAAFAFFASTRRCPIRCTVSNGVTPTLMSAIEPQPSSLRASRRFSHGVECDVELHGLGRARLECVDLSAVGAFFAMPVCPDEGTQVRCVIPLPGGGLWLVAGRVVRVSLGRDEPRAGVGVAFRGVSAFDRRRLITAFR